MTKKHYEALAAGLRDAWDTSSAAREFALPIEDERRAVWVACVEAVAAVCATDNPRFDTARFYEACGLIVW